MPGQASVSHRKARAWWLPALVLLMLLSGCATTREVGFVDPAHARARYGSFLAYAAFRDLGIEASYERALCRSLHAAHQTCTTLLRAAPPTREQTGASRHAAARASGAAASIVVALVDVDSRARRALSDGGPSYRVSVIDNAAQAVVARFAVHTPASAGRSTPRLAQALARAVTRGLRENHLLMPH